MLCPIGQSNEKPPLPALAKWREYVTLTFELSWKALQEIMRKHSVEGASTGSPREILQLGYKIGFINDAEIWLLMLKKRNTSVYIYNEDEIDELILLIRDSFIPAFTVLKDTLVKKLEEAESDWM